MTWLRLTGPLDRFTWRLLATALVGQGLAVFFGALVGRAIAEAQGAAGSTALLVGGSVLALLCFVAAGLMRGRWGVTLGWLIQAATLASAVAVPMMAVVGLAFLAVWVLMFRLGDRAERTVRGRAAPQ